MTEAVREIYWNIGELYGATALYLTAIVALAIMTIGM
jgi:hypothetical protein